MPPTRLPPRTASQKPAANRRAPLPRSFVALPIVDIMLVAGGIALAASSVSFAGYMLVQDVRRPLIHDMEYLALFAQPNKMAKQAAVAPGRSKIARPEGLDMTATGSIDPQSGQATSGALRLVGGRSDVAYVSDGTAIRAVRPGDRVAGLGQVASIEKRGGRWALLDANAVVLLVQEPSDANARGEERFARPMIFTPTGR